MGGVTPRAQFGERSCVVPREYKDLERTNDSERITMCGHVYGINMDGGISKRSISPLCQNSSQGGRYVFSLLRAKEHARR